MHKWYFCHTAHFSSSPKSPDIEAQQHFGQKYPKLFTWHHLRGETVPIWAGWHCQHQHLSSSPPSKRLHFCFLCYKLCIPACLWAQSGSAALSASAGLFAGEFEFFFFAAGKGGTWIQLWVFCLLGCFLHLISLLSTRFLSIRGVLSCSCKSGGWENICWTWNEWPPVPPEICFLLGHLHLPLYLCAVCV